MKKIITLAAFALLALAVLSTAAKAQSASVFTGGLRAPNRLAFTPGGNLLVVENGTGHMDGRVSIIDRNAARMRNLIDDILELSAIEAGTVTVERSPVRLRPLSHPNNC